VQIASKFFKSISSKLRKNIIGTKTKESKDLLEYHKNERMKGRLMK